ncbi:MAG: c-type cytochrome, partial [Candidatus Dadabacteria bacterium]|nr:c-type cytochrome [Candidatus Dadabacteria bacterium]NIX16315.1 c-type cytochrome [Candidatus Dadabacteria bacterium]
MPLNLVASENKDAKRILSLVDYIGGDYQNAVADGKIINTDEYNEMLDFSATASELGSSIKTDKEYVKDDTRLLSKLINDKADVQSVLNLSNKIKQNLISDFNLKTYPDTAPSIKVGRMLYANNCSQCHGLTGMADGQLADGLVPHPANFAKGDLIEGLSAFKVYNTVSFGISGTGMPSFPNLSEEQKWDIAFYVLSIRYEDDSQYLASTVDIPQDLNNHKVLATISDDDIRGRLSSRSYNENQINNIIAGVRTHSHLSKDINSDNEPLILTVSLLKESISLYEKGDKELAYSKAIDAYLDGFEKIENKLAIKDNKLTRNIENKFGEYRGQIKSGEPLQTVKTTYQQLNSGLNDASVLLTNTKPLGKFLSFVQSFAIIVREGLEAVLIVAAIIAFLTTTGS